MNKAATMIYSDAFIQEWNGILSTCSIDLMKLITKYEKNSLEELGLKINELQKSALKLTIPEGLATLLGGINNNLTKLEDHITQMKRGKF